MSGTRVSRRCRSLLSQALAALPREILEGCSALVFPFAKPARQSERRAICDARRADSGEDILGRPKRLGSSHADLVSLAWRQTRRLQRVGDESQMLGRRATLIKRGIAVRLRRARSLVLLLALRAVRLINAFTNTSLTCPARLIILARSLSF